jgi:hypothetical protein
MKKINILLFLISIILIFGNKNFAQQDYQLVQNFKDKYQQIHESIKNADSLAQLNQIQDQIDELESNYISHKDLLDKSLYPDDFNSSISKLRSELTVRRGDFTTISTLNTRVSELSIEIDSLNKKNTFLINQVQDLQAQSQKDKHTLARLETSLTELRRSLRNRDDLVMSMLDSLIPSPINLKSGLSKQEKQKIFSRARRFDIISNIEKAIDDNVTFLNVTTLGPKDIISIKKQELQFENLWKEIGPKIIKIYSERRQNVKNVQEIDAAFTEWDSAIQQEPWNSIRQKFANNGINLSRFTNGQEFAYSISSYIRDEINNASVNGTDMEKSAYELFADSVWDGNIKPVWMPYLSDNNMITKAEQDTIDTNISKWRSVVSPGFFSNWFFIAIVVLALLVIILLFTSRSLRKNKTSESLESSEV